MFNPLDPKRSTADITIPKDFLYGHILFDLKIKGLSNNDLVSLENSLLSTIKSTPQYDQEGKEQFKVKIKGYVKGDIKTKTVSKVHEYSVSIPYEDTIPVKKQEKFHTNLNSTNVIVFIIMKLNHLIMFVVMPRLHNTEQKIIQIM